MTLPMPVIIPNLVVSVYDQALDKVLIVSAIATATSSLWGRSNSRPVHESCNTVLYCCQILSVGLNCRHIVRLGIGVRRS
jgi:hypothetical protein